MSLDSKKLVEGALSAFKGELEAHWKLVKPYAEAEARKLAETAKLIVLGVADKSISKEQAKILISMQAGATQAVLTSIATIGMIAAQDAINAALKVVYDAINAGVGFALL
jgi:hypothetical protein